MSERRATSHQEEKTCLIILISFDIGGTLEVSDPPGMLSMEMVRRAQEKGFLIGSCSDLPINVQKAIWVQYKIPVDFVVAKHMLHEVKAKFEADVYYHIGDRLVDQRIALEAGFEFLWPREAIVKPWFRSDGNPGH